MKNGSLTSKYRSYVVRPAKAGLFSRSQSCQGKRQRAVAWMTDTQGTASVLEPTELGLKGER